MLVDSDDFSTFLLSPSLVRSVALRSPVLRAASAGPTAIFTPLPRASRHGERQSGIWRPKRASSFEDVQGKSIEARGDLRAKISVVEKEFNLVSVSE